MKSSDREQTKGQQDASKEEMNSKLKETAHILAKLIVRQHRANMKSGCPPGKKYDKTPL